MGRLRCTAIRTIRATSRLNSASVLTTESLRNDLREAGFATCAHVQLEQVCRATRASAHRRAAEGRGMTRTPRKVVHAAENIKGGVGTYLRDLLQMQRNQFGDGVVVAVCRRPRARFSARRSVSRSLRSTIAVARWLSMLRVTKRVREVMGWSMPSIVHIHSTYAGLALRPMLKWMRLARRNRRRRSSTARTAGRSDRQIVAAREAACHGASSDCLRPWCDAIVCISRHEMRIAEQAWAFRRAISFTSPTALPRKRRRRRRRTVEWPANRRRVLFVGRFDRQKGVDVPLDALARLQISSFAYARGASVLGDGRGRNGSSSRRTFARPAGSRRPSWPRTTRAPMCSSSRPDGQASVSIAAEAMRAGLAVIATQCRWLARSREENVTGLLVRAGRRAGASSRPSAR